MSENQNRLDRLKIAIELRNFEIRLFWTRSLFFWGFIATAIGSYAIGYEHLPPEILLLLSSFGFACGIGWSLANRGSKYWQENWEQKAENEEASIGPLIGEPLPAQKKGFWLSGRRFSVSKLVIALSDFLSLLLCFLMFWTCVHFQKDFEHPILSYIIVFVAFVFSASLVWASKND